MTRLFRLITSILMIFITGASITLVSLAWYSSSAIATDNFQIVSNGYTTLIYCAVPQYYTDDSTVDSYNDNGSNWENATYETGKYVASNDAVKMLPAVVSLNTVKDSFVDADVRNTGNGIETAAVPAVFRSTVQFSNRESYIGNNFPLQISASAYAIVPYGQSTKNVQLSLQKDLLLVTDVKATYEDDTVAYFDNNLYSAPTQAQSKDYFNLNLSNKSATLSITTKCYLRQVDELISPDLRNAQSVYITLTISATPFTKRFYYFNADAWSTVNAIAWGYGRRPISQASNNNIMITGVDGDTDIGIPMIRDASLSTGTAYLYTGLFISSTTWRIGFAGITLGEYSVTGATVTDEKLRFSSTGYYTIKLNVSSKTIKVTSETKYPTPATQYLGSDGTSMTPVVGQPGWYAIDVPTAAERIYFTDGENKTSSARIDQEQCFMYNGSWYDTIQSTAGTIFFYNTQGWGSVSAVTYNSESPAIITNTAMSSRGNGWYSVKLSGTDDRIYFTGNSEQTSSINLDLDSGAIYYFNGKWYATPPEP